MSARGIPFFNEDPIQSKATAFDLMGYSPNPVPEAEPVVDFHRDSATRHIPHQIISAPARTSKSYSAAPEASYAFFPELERRDGSIKPVRHENINWLVGTDYDGIKEWDYVWGHLIDGKLIEQLGGTVERAHNSPRQGNMQIVATFGRTHDGRISRSVMQGKSASNEKSLQGEEVNVCILSEAADHEQRVVDKYLQPRCYRMIYPTTPKRRAMWLYEMIESGKGDSDLGIDHYQFSGHCNPTYDWDRFERAKRKAILNYGAWQKDPEFCEQMMGWWTFEGGKVLPFRWLEDGSGLPLNVQGHPDWMSYGDFIVSTDYGFADAAVALWTAVGPNRELHVAAELYERHLTSGDFVKQVHDKSRAMNVDPIYYVADPKRPYVGADLRKLGMPVQNRVKPNKLADRAAGYQRLREALAIDPDVGMCGLTVHPSCEHTIAEWKHLRFKDGYSNEFSEAAIHGADHATDAARYMLMSDPLPSMDSGRDWFSEWEESQRTVQRWARERAWRDSRRGRALVGANPETMAGVS